MELFIIFAVYQIRFMVRQLHSLFTGYTGISPETCTPIAGSGSDRRYCRFAAGEVSVIGVSGEDRRENAAFIALDRHFLSKGLNVPEVYSVSDDGLCYIQEDLGSESLYDAVASGRKAAADGLRRGTDISAAYSDGERGLLVNAVSMLPEIQVLGAQGLDFSLCYPVPEFDARSVMFDLHYFKYCFLRLTGIQSDEMRLEDDFEAFRDRLLSVEGNDFMYRDFQARNIMLHDGKPFFIDFQGGRKGPVHYDLASFVWQAKACYPRGLKADMVSAYIDALGKFRHVDETRFMEDLRQFVLFRLLQVLGAYGFRGLYGRKPHFIESIPFAMANLREFLSSGFSDYPYLLSLLERLSAPDSGWSLPVSRSGVRMETNGLRQEEKSVLTVEVTSFSYRKGIPEDSSGNGGGYVFDCRALVNPGRYERYRNSTGMDADVIRFLEEDRGVGEFIGHACSLADAHVRNFLERGFSHLCVAFGCTGGQHRSVYCAESVARHLASVYGADIRIVLTHREQGITRRIGECNAVDMNVREGRSE